MNEYEEAIETINNEILLCYGEETVGEYESDTDNLYNAFDSLKKLASKETPKKPIDIEFGPCGDSMLCCPNCEHGVVPIPTYHGNRYYPRCPFCGQKLKGDDKDENC